MGLFISFRHSLFTIHYFFDSLYPVHYKKAIIHLSVYPIKTLGYGGNLYDITWIIYAKFCVLVPRRNRVSFELPIGGTLIFHYT